MIVNFRTCKINQDTRKLIWIPILIIIKKSKPHLTSKLKKEECIVNLDAADDHIIKTQ
jgi:hypothetical protein